jgi:hypothetical protein
MLAAAKRIHPDLREQFEAQGESVPLRRLFRAAYSSADQPSEPTVGGEGKSSQATEENDNADEAANDE